MVQSIYSYGIIIGSIAHDSQLNLLENTINVLIKINFINVLKMNKVFIFKMSSIKLKITTCKIFCICICRCKLIKIQA